ncbi:MAG: multiheme c-type cytochrome [Planctomycetota bacterium]
MVRIISHNSIYKTCIFVFMLLISCNQHGAFYGVESESSLHEDSTVSSVHVAFTGEENGYLEPCGCSEAQLGGFPKRHTLINHLMKKDENLILLSLGDIPDKIGRQDEIKMETALSALDQMGYVAHNLGEKDLDIGSDLLGYLSQISNVDFLSSNIVDFTPQVLNIKPYIIKEIKNKGLILRVGILGILSPELIESNYQDMEVKDPVESLKPLISDLIGKTDFLILLSHAEMEESVRIAEACPEFDLIISGHRVDRPDLYLEKVNNTYVIPVGEKGKYLGKITLQLRRKQLGADQHVSSFVPPIETIALDERYEDSPEIESLLKIYQQRLKDEELVKNLFKTEPPSNLAFIGNNDCSACHNKIFKHWEETSHASAYETLLKSGHEYDPECLECHTIGLNYFTGFETIETTPELKGVGCESCHGPGSSHKETQSKDYGGVGVDQCIVCHESEHSPHFQYGDYWKKIVHPLEEK